MNKIQRQILVMTSANLKARYRNTVSGFLWVVMNPILMFGAQAYAFHYILKINVEEFPIFLLSGLIPWLFLIQSADMGTGSFINNGRLLKSFPIHPVVPLAAQIADNLINFFAAFLILFIPVSLSSHLFHWISLPLLIIPLAILLLGTFSIVWLLATTNVFFQDMKFIVSFLGSVTFYLTPIIYPEGFVSENIHWIFNVNPVYHLIMPFRLAVMDPLSAEFWYRCGLGALVAVGFFIWAALYWRKKRNSVYFYL